MLCKRYTLHRLSTAERRRVLCPWCEVFVSKYDVLNFIVINKPYDLLGCVLNVSVSVLVDGGALHHIVC